MDTASTSSNPATQVRQKRVLPSRSRRGGPGVGNCDADVMILETQRRKFENEPLIPADTPFLLTTNSAAASTSSATFRLNVYANDRYFERPEVLKAYREQLIIQTPEFVSLGDTPTGRLRARSQAGMTEDGPPETSDAAYEKRHRKYETFEKRQRLREKEKLKHEQYKLKERIDQLRAMDASAFLSLPDSLFPAPASEVEPQVEDGEGSLSPMHVNGGPSYREGERRRKEMLDIAYALEERYRVLLPPDRVRKPVGQISTDASVEPEIPAVYVEREKVVEPEDEHSIETARQESGRPRIKLKLTSRAPSATIQPSASKSASYKRRQSAPPAPKQQPARRATITREEPVIRPASPLVVVDLPRTSLHEAAATPPPVPCPSQDYPPAPYPAVEQPTAECAVSRPTTPMSNPEIAVLEPGSPETEVVVDEEQQVSVSTDQLDSTSRSYKRARLSSIPPSASTVLVMRESSMPPIESISAPVRRRSPSHASTVQSSRHHASERRGPRQRSICILMTQAMHNQGKISSKAKRHLTAFGGKLQNETFFVADFDLREWIDIPKDKDPDYVDTSDPIPGVRTILTAAEFSNKTESSTTGADGAAPNS